MNTKKIILIIISISVALGIVAAIIFIEFVGNKSVSAYTKLNNGEYNEAIKEFDELIAKNNKDISAYAGKAMAQISSGDEEGASDTINTMAVNCDNPNQWTENTSQSTKTNKENTKQTNSQSGNNASYGEATSSSTGAGNGNGTDNTVVFNLPQIDNPKNPPIDEIIRAEYMWQFRYNVKTGKPERNEEIFNTIEKNGLNAHYNIYTRPAMPTTDCPANKYDQPIIVNLYCLEGNTVRYRMEAGEITMDNSALYEQPIRIAKNHSTTNIVAAAYDTLYIPSEPINLTYELDRKPLAVPESSHNSGEYTSKFSLSLKNPNDEGKIYYTTDDSEPTTTSKEYSGKISISEGTTNIKAKVIDSENDISSEILVLNYTVKIPKKSVPIGPTCPYCGSSRITKTWGPKNGESFFCNDCEGLWM